MGSELQPAPRKKANNLLHSSPSKSNCLPLMKSSSVVRHVTCIHPKKPYWEMPVQVKERNMTLTADDKQIFLFRKEASEANEGREVISDRKSVV